MIKFRGMGKDGLCYTGDLVHFGKVVAIKTDPYMDDYEEVDPDTVAQLIGYDCEDKESYSDDCIVKSSGEVSLVKDLTVRVKDIGKDTYSWKNVTIIWDKVVTQLMLARGFKRVDEPRGFKNVRKPKDIRDTTLQFIDTSIGLVKVSVYSDYSYDIRCTLARSDLKVMSPVYKDIRDTNDFVDKLNIFITLISNV